MDIAPFASVAVAVVVVHSLADTSEQVVPQDNQILLLLLLHCSSAQAFAVPTSEFRSEPLAKPQSAQVA